MKNLSKPLGFLTTGVVCCFNGSGSLVSHSEEILVKFPVLNPIGICSIPNLKENKLTLIAVSCGPSRGEIQVFDISTSKPKVVRTIGKGTLKDPQHMCWDSTRETLWVCDREQKCVFGFSIDGKCVEKFGVNHLEGPTGIAIDRDKFIVSDYEGNCLCIFESV